MGQSRDGPQVPQPTAPFSTSQNGGQASHCQGPDQAPQLARGPGLTLERGRGCCGSRSPERAGRTHGTTKTVRVCT